jgi:methyl-accepting chemotaxis protein
MESLTMTNLWLAILAVVSLLEFLLICAAGFFAYRTYRRAMAAIETVERVHIRPLRARADFLLDEVQKLVDRVKHAQESVGDALSQVAGTGSAVAETVKAKAWPVVGIVQGIRAAAHSIRKNGKKDEPPFAHYGT